jgi:hypothetical protein
VNYYTERGQRFVSGDKVILECYMIVDNRRVFRNQVNDCTRDCLECNYVCQQAIAHCLRKGVPYSNPVTIGLLQDCVELSQIAANLMIRDSTMYPRFCQLCAELCQKSADICRQLNDDEHLFHCTHVLLQCAESCAGIGRFVVPSPCVAATA